MTPRCCEASLAAGEALAATAVTASLWLLLEVPGSWPRDVGDDGALPGVAQEAANAWLGATPGGRLQFVRRPGRAARRPTAFVVRAEESRREVRRFELERLEDLGTLDLGDGGDAVDGSLVLVCGHGSRDACCAREGTAVFGALEGRLAAEALWISSHLGGHRFAANVLVLPDGIQLGRVGAGEAPAVVAQALAGRIELDRYRGRTCYPPPVQAAEHALRTTLGLDGVDDLRLVAVREDTVRFRSREGTDWEASVERVDGPEVPASCGDEPKARQALVARVR